MSRWKIACFITFCLLSPAMVFAQLELTIKPDTTRILVGMPLDIQVQLRYEASAIFDKPEFTGLFTSVKDVELLHDPDWDTIQSGNPILLRKQITCIPWDTGVVMLKSIEIPYVFEDKEGLARSENIFFRVFTPSVDEQKDIFDIKDIIRQEGTTYHWEWVAGLVLFFLSAFSVWWFYFRKKRVFPVKKEVLTDAPIYLNPIDEALNQLIELKHSNITTEKEYYAQMTYIIRKYLSKTIQSDAMNQPTTDMISSLASVITEEQAYHLNRLMRRSDLVKFAKGQTTEQIRIDSIEEAMVTLRDLDRKYYAQNDPDSAIEKENTQ